MGIHRSPEERRRASLEQLLGKLTDTFLARRGIHTDSETRWKLIERASVDLPAAAKKLSQNADGDFTPDDYRKRFPEFEEQSGKADDKHSLTKLAEDWHKAALDRGVKKRDAMRIKDRFGKLIEFLKHDDARRVTKDDIVRWRDYRLSINTSVKTINASDIASFSNVFAWGVERKRLALNPAEKMTIKTNRKKAKTRDEFYTPDEAAMLLRHAAAATGSKRENPKTTAAKRWVLWLCAYSGARVSEMIQLRKQDVRNDSEHGWIIRLSPEAGSIKTNKFCDVPVHEHLVSEGFIEFVKESKTGHLFCDPNEDGTLDGPAEGVYSRIRKMVREALKEAAQPTHGWRYTFKTYGMEVDIQEHVLDAISNHEAKHQGGKYTKVTLKARAEAMRRFPRYKTGNS